MRKIFLIITIMVILVCNTVYAETIPPLKTDTMDTNEFPLLWDLMSGDYQIWSDGSRVETNYVDGLLEVTIDTTNQIDQDYYTAHIYKTGSFDWTDYGEISFDFVNLTSEIMKMNFVITDRYYENYRLTEEMPVLAMPIGSSIKELIPNQWGAADIPPDFAGEIHIPDYNVTDNVLGSIISFGISITIPKDTVQSFRISNVKLVPIEYSSPVYGFFIEGDNEIQLPVVGESVAYYRVVFNDVYIKDDDDFVVSEKVTFSLSEELEGISITKDGTLTVNENVKEYYFKIYVDVNGEVREALPVSLIDHWSKDLNLENDIKLHLPKPDEIKDLNTGGSLLFKSGTISLLRIIFFVFSISLCGLYFWWKNTWKGRSYEKQKY